MPILEPHLESPEIKLFPRFQTPQSLAPPRESPHPSVVRHWAKTSARGRDGSPKGSLGLVECIGLVAKTMTGNGWCRFMFIYFHNLRSDISSMDWFLMGFPSMNELRCLPVSPWKKPSAFAQLKPVSDLEPTPTRTPLCCREPLTQLAAVPLPVPVPPSKGQKSWHPQIDTLPETNIAPETLGLKD